MEGLTYDWVWYRHARDQYVALSERAQAALDERVSSISRNPWPDGSSKEFVNDLPLDTLVALAQAGESYHLILYADDEWAIVYEVVQPWVFVIYSVTPL